MEFTLSIACDNAAFDPDPEIEIARILRDAAERVERGEGIERAGQLRDANGNHVGSFRRQ